MSGSADRDLIAGLTADLAPVRPAPRLGLAAGAVFALASASVAGVLSGSPSLDALGLRLATRPEFAGVLLGLAVAGVAGTLGALTAAAPDRERQALGGAGVAAASVALTAGLCLAAWAVAQSGSTITGSAHLACLRRSVLFALAPAAALVFFCLRGWVARPRIAAAAGLVGAFSLGALALHLECAALEPLHLLLGHVGSPVVAIALGIAPLSWLLRRSAG